MRKLLAGVLIAGSTVPLLAGVASAAPAKSRDLDAEKAKCTAAIDKRLDQLTKLDGRVAGAKSTTEAHRSTMTSNNAAARSGLTDLKTTIAGDTDAATLKTDCQSIVQDYRVFALRTPQEDLVIAADAESAAIAKLQALGDKLSADDQAKVADAAQQIGGLADSVLAKTPADYNADHDVLKPAKASIKAAAADLKAVRADLRSQQKSTTTSTTQAPQQ